MCKCVCVCLTTGEFMCVLVCVCVSGWGRGNGMCIKLWRGWSAVRVILKRRVGCRCPRGNVEGFLFGMVRGVET